MGRDSLMPRVLVTGATGFIGRHCLPVLEQHGYEVHAVSSRGPLPEFPHCRWYRSDLLAANTVPALLTEVRPTHLLHLAWFARPGEYWESPANVDWVRASLALVRTFEHIGGRRAVLVGSCAEYDWRYGYCSEDTTPLAPTTLYGVSKHCLEMLVNAYAARAELSVGWGRPFFVYGPYEASSRLVPSVVQALLQEKPVYCSQGNQVRDYLYVADVAHALVTLLGSEFRGPVNIASGIPVRVKDLIRCITNVLGREQLVRMGTRSSPVDEPAFIIGDVGRLGDRVGWHPRYNMEAGILESIEWWRKREMDKFR